ncbi:hypothetical protein F5887DRAFT_1157016 [Amanita rubescens]|nr:hypothetical protein F5887DRAFT_1157016 [Amanita rubescens]
MFNPFSGWAETRKGMANESSVPPPSIFGALPYPAPSSNSLKLEFTSFNPSVLNCTVLGTQGQVFYQVVTDPHNPGYTVLKNASGKNVALVEWQGPPARGDSSSRIMDVRGIHYTWAPHNKTIQLIATGPSDSILLASIMRGTEAISLEVTPDAIQLGILDSIVTATFLLQSGRNVD